MDKNCSIHAKTPTYHVTFLKARMRVRAHTHVPMYVNTSPKCREIHSTKHCTAEIRPYFLRVVS